MKKFVFAPVLAALAMFVWGFLYWGLPHNLPYKTLGHLDDESATALALGKLFPATGAYLIPNPMSGEAKVNELTKRGPLAQVFITKEGMTPMDPAVLFKGYLHGLVIAVLLSTLLSAFGKSLETWKCRVMACAGIGLLVAIASLGQAVWWHHPWGWALANAVYNFVLFAVAGLVLAKFHRPTTTAAS